MFLHLGGGVLAPHRAIIAIIDLNENYLPAGELIQYWESRGKLQRIAEKGKEKSLIITGERQYLSPISSVALGRRAGSLKEMLKEAEKEA